MGSWVGWNVVVVAGQDGLGHDGVDGHMGRRGLVVGDVEGLLVVLDVDGGCVVQADRGVVDQRRRSVVNWGGVVDWSSVQNRSVNRGRLGDHGYVVGVTVADDVRGVNVAQTVVQDVAGQTARTGVRHRQHYCQNCLSSSIKSISYFVYFNLNAPLPFLLRSLFFNWESSQEFFNYSRTNFCEILEDYLNLTNLYYILKYWKKFFSHLATC